MWWLAERVIGSAGHVCCISHSDRLSTPVRMFHARMWWRISDFAYHSPWTQNLIDGFCATALKWEVLEYIQTLMSAFGGLQCKNAELLSKQNENQIWRKSFLKSFCHRPVITHRIFWILMCCRCSLTTADLEVSYCPVIRLMGRPCSRLPFCSIQSLRLRSNVPTLIQNHS